MQSDRCRSNAHRSNLTKGAVLITSLAIVFSLVRNGQTQGSFTLPRVRTNGSGCIREGQTVIYRCSVADTAGGGLTTIWRGSAFDCSQKGNELALPHHQYGMGINMSCSNFALNGEGIRNVSDEYMSRLSVSARQDLNGTTILCVRSPSTIIGSDTLPVGVTPPSPGPISITFSSDSDPLFTVSWSPPSGVVVGGVGGYMFGVTGDNCGCVDMNVSADTTSVTCSGWTTNDQTCSFELRTLTQDCGFVSSSAVTGNVILSNSNNRNFQVSASEHAIIITIPSELIKVMASPRDLYTLIYGPSTNSSMLMNISAEPSIEDSTLTINISETLDLLTEYYFTLFLEHGENNLILYGTFVLRCDPESLGGNPTSQRESGKVTVTNGMINYNGVTPGSTAYLVCNESYVPDAGSTNRTCMINGTWSGDNQSCTPVTPEPTGMTLACEEACITGIVVGILALVVLLILCCVCVTIVFIYKNNKRKGKMSINDVDFSRNISESTDQQNQSGGSPPPTLPLYADPEDVIQQYAPAIPPRFYSDPDESELLSNEQLEMTDMPNKSEYENMPSNETNMYQTVGTVKPPTKPADSPAPPQLYSEVFDALPKGKSHKIINKSTLTRAA